MDKSFRAAGDVDPNALTQPIPVVPAGAATRTSVFPDVSATVVPPVVPLPAVTAVPAPYRHRFGNVGFYLLGRFAACFIDVFAVAFALAAFAYHALDAGLFALAARSETTFLALAAVGFGGALAIAFFCESVFGTTIGKLVFALHVRRRNGGHAGAPRVVARYLFRPLDALVIGPLLALVTPRHQRLGDFVAGTVVARSRLGFFASLLGIALLAALAYAQITFGGGLTSAVGVSAEAADYAPPLVERVRAALGFAHTGAVRLQQAQPQPSAAATDVL